MQKTALLLSNGMLVTGVLASEEEAGAYRREVLPVSRDGVLLKDALVDPPGRRLKWLFVPDSAVLAEGEPSGPSSRAAIQAPDISGLKDITDRSRR